MELTDNARDSEARGVSMETNRKIEIKVTKNRSRSKPMFEFLKSFLSLRVPMGVLVLAKESGDNAGDMGISLDKVMIKISEAQKDLDILN